MNGEEVLSLVLITLLLSSAVALTGCTEEGTTKEDPEGVMKSYVEDVNTGNYQDAFNRTIYKFNQNRYEHMVNESGEKQDIEINDINVTYEKDMNESRKEAIEEYIPQLEENYSVDVEEYCLLELNYTDSDRTKDSFFTMVKIDSDWFLTFYKSRLNISSTLDTKEIYIDGTDESNLLSKVRFIDDNTEHTIYVRAYDQGGDTLEGAKVKVEGLGLEKTSTTDQDGWVEFTYDPTNNKSSDGSGLPVNQETGVLDITVTYLGSGSESMKNTLRGTVPVND